MRALLLVLLVTHSVWSMGQTPHAERILHYEVDVHVDTTSSITVTEKIRITAAGQEIKRGIFRSLPLRRIINEQDKAVRYTILSVRRDGEEEEYHTERNNNHLFIYIGKEDYLLSPGVYEYELVYSTDGQIGFYDTFDELYWNVTGTDWVFPIDHAIARIILPSAAQIQQQACYTGPIGSTAQECTFQRLSDHILQWEAKFLYPKDGLTVAVGFDKGLIAQPTLPSVLHTKNLIALVSFVSLLLFIAMWVLWNRYGRDHPFPTVIPRFDVPRNFSPAAMGYLHRGAYHSKFLSSSIINMAIKGYLHIEEVVKAKKKEYILHKRKSTHHGLPEEEAALFQHLFGKGPSSISLNGVYDPNVEEAAKSHYYLLYSRYNPQIKKGNNWLKVMSIFLLFSAVYWLLIAYIYRYLFEQEKVAVATILYAVSFLVVIIAMISRIAFAKKLILLTATATLIGIVAWLVLVAQKMGPFTVVYFFLGFATVATLVFNYLIKQPSKELLVKQAEIRGFKMYIETAEAELLRFNNPPEFTPALYEKFLPYALVLGVEGIWGKKLEQLLQGTPSDYNHGWYSGGTSMVTNSAFGSSLYNSLSSSLSSSSTNPSSGSGGGGSSGGGGGGGGGGGW